MDPNNLIRSPMSHTSEKLLDDNSPQPNRSVPASPKKSRDNALEPNDFFDGGKHDEEVDGVPRAVSFDFDLNPGSSADDNEAFDPMLNIVHPAFTTRIKLYLKPKDASVSTMMFLLILDTVLALSYIWAQFAYVIDGSYEEEQDKVVQLLIAFGITGAIL